MYQYCVEEDLQVFCGGLLETGIGRAHNVALASLPNPAGIVKAGPVVGEEALLTAEFHRDERRATKAYFDAMGHYARWDAVSLSISDETFEPVRDAKPERQRLSAHRAEELATEYDVPVEAVEAVADELRE
jgi:amidase/nitrilase